MDEFTPQIHPTDKHPETPKTGDELDMADADTRVREAKEREEATKRIAAETETPEQHAFRLEQLHRLNSRYGNGKSDSEAA